jgi:hypothetical protein
MFSAEMEWRWKMAKSRSPEYPAIGLQEAIEKVRSAYSKGLYQSLVSKKALAEAMGYKSLSGASLPVLSAVAKYGLIEGRGENTRISDLAVSIIAHEPGTPERAKAIREAAGRPELFAQLDERSNGGKTTDAAIRSYLLTRRFIPPAADAVIRSYRETKELVEAESRGYDQTEFEPDEAAQNDRQKKGDPGRREPPSDPPERRSTQLSRRPPVTAGKKQDVFSLPEGEVVLEWPEPLSPESYEDFESWINLVLRRVKRSVREPTKEQGNPPTEQSAHSERATASVSLMITQEQKSALRERGYDDQRIREMKPEDVHRVLGIVN